MNELSVFVLILFVLIIILVKMGIKIVSQADIYIIERLGRFYRVLDGGFHIIVPFFDVVRAKMKIGRASCRERV